jgi:hypothetical protein
VPHQRWTDASRSAVAVKGHAHSTNTHWYRKVDGVWKFAGLCPEIRWGEYDFDKVFAGGRDEFGAPAGETATTTTTAAGDKLPGVEIHVEHVEDGGVPTTQGQTPQLGVPVM